MITPIRPDIQRIEAGHYEMLVRFFSENDVAEVVRRFNPFPLNRETAYRIACTDCLDRYYVTLYENKIVGLCMLRGWDEGYSIPSFGVLVDRHFHNHGVGREMTVYAIEEARRLGCHRVRLSVYASNKPALHLYTSLGFTEDKREIVRVMGELDEKVIMSKDLLSLR